MGEGAHALSNVVTEALQTTKVTSQNIIIVGGDYIVQVGRMVVLFWLWLFDIEISWLRHTPTTTICWSIAFFTTFIVIDNGGSDFSALCDGDCDCHSSSSGWRLFYNSV